jgi:hypothetical protein
MKNVAPLLGPLPLLIALSSCSEEGTIGRERCLGENTRCEPAPPELGMYDISNAKPVSSDVTREAKLIWSVNLDCPRDCSAPALSQLVDDGEGGVWILHPPGGLGALGGSGGLGALDEPRPGFKYERVDDRGNVVVRHEEPLAGDEVFSISPFSRAWPHPEGGVVLARTSSLFDRVEPLPFVHHLMRVGDDGVSDLIVGRSRVGSRVGFWGPEQLFDLMPSHDGFITVMLGAEAQVVRKIDASGDTIWRQVELPSGSETPWGMVPLDSGFALLTSSELYTTLGAIPTLLWFDADGNVMAQSWLPFNSLNQRPAVLGLSGARVASAGIAASLDDSLPPNGYVFDLHVVRLAPDATATGHRIVNEGLSPLSVGSLAVDGDDTIYVTSVTGTRRSPRGLICALPDQGDGSCYLAPQGVSLQGISAPAPGVLYALSGEALVKLELP